MERSVPNNPMSPHQILMTRASRGDTETELSFFRTWSFRRMNVHKKGYSFGQDLLTCIIKQLVEPSGEDTRKEFQNECQGKFFQFLLQ